MTFLHILFVAGISVRDITGSEPGGDSKFQQIIFGVTRLRRKADNTKTPNSRFHNLLIQNQIPVRHGIKATPLVVPKPAKLCYRLIFLNLNFKW